MEQGSTGAESPSAPHQAPPSTANEAQQKSLPSSTSSSTTLVSTAEENSTSTAQTPEVSNTPKAKKARHRGSRKNKRRSGKVEETKVDLDSNSRLKSHLPSARMVLSGMPGVPARLLGAVDSELATVLLDTIPAAKWNSFVCPTSCLYKVALKSIFICLLSALVDSGFGSY